MNIAEIGKKAGFSTQEQFAVHMGIPKATLAKWEAGITMPKTKDLTTLATALGCTTDELLGRTGERRTPQ